MGCHNAIAIQLEKAFSQLKPPPKLTLSEWAEQYAYLSAESSAQAGKWHNIPYQVGIMDAVTDPKVERIVFMKSARVGYTKILNNAIAYHIHADPCSILMVQPTINDADKYSKNELAPMFRDTPCLKPLVPDEKTRTSKNTIRRKAYPGGSIEIIGANSATGFRGRTVRLVMFDEVDGYPPAAGQEGDQITLGSKRADYFWNSKIFIGSTPTTKGGSRIEDWFSKGDQRYYYVPCPHCQHMQILVWERIDFGMYGFGTREKPVYVCEACEKPIEYRNHRWMIENGKWRASAPFNGTASFHIWAGYSYSPKATWRHIVEAFLESKGDIEAYKSFRNTWLGQTWEEDSEKLNPTNLSARREKHGQVMPMNSAILTATVDVQADRFEVLVKAWGYDEESWDIEHLPIFGDTKLPEPWERLDQYLMKQFKHENGSLYNIHAVGVDTGYQPSPLVYEFCRKRQTRNVYALKGSSNPSKPILPPKPTRRNKGNVNLYEIGVSVAKDLLFSRLQLIYDSESERHPGYIHFGEFTDEFFEQLTVEQKKLRYDHSRQYYEWVNPGKRRNEAWDLEVYQIATLKIICPDVAMLNRYVDAASKPQAQEEKPENKPAPSGRNRGGFVRSW